MANHEQRKAPKPTFRPVFLSRAVWATTVLLGMMAAAVCIAPVATSDPAKAPEVLRVAAGLLLASAAAMVASFCFGDIGQKPIAVRIQGSASVPCLAASLTMMACGGWMAAVVFAASGLISLAGLGSFYFGAIPATHQRIYSNKQTKARHDYRVAQADHYRVRFHTRSSRPAIASVACFALAALSGPPLLLNADLPTWMPWGAVCLLMVVTMLLALKIDQVLAQELADWSRFGSKTFMKRYKSSSRR